MASLSFHHHSSISILPRSLFGLSVNYRLVGVGDKSRHLPARQAVQIYLWKTLITVGSFSFQTQTLEVLKYHSKSVLSKLNRDGFDIVELQNNREQRFTVVYMLQIQVSFCFVVTCCPRGLVVHMQIFAT